MPWRENKGVANLDGFRRIYFSCLKARNLWRKSLLKNGRGPEINHRN